jgi:small-conductance mechanosensitive channel
MEVMKSHEYILDDPKPYVLFQSFGDNSKIFEARCWTSNYGAWLDTMSELNVAIDKKFAEKGIVIAFPQLDLHVKEVNMADKKET